MKVNNKKDIFMIIEKYTFNSLGPLNVGTVPTFKMLNVGTVPKFKMLNVGTVPTFKKLNVGTIKNV